jgi:hypothetical protein
MIGPYSPEGVAALEGDRSSTTGPMMVEEVISLRRASESRRGGDDSGRAFRIGTEMHHTSVQAQTSRISPWWAALTVWGVVNAVNVLQSAGFFSRVITGNRAINHLLGYGIVALAIPVTLATVAFVRARAGWQYWIGSAAFLAFVVLMIVVDYIWQVEFRSPAMRYNVLVPYLVLFFGSILLMGLPMFRMNRRLWLVTVVSTILLLGSMGCAMYMGVG